MKNITIENIREAIAKVTDPRTEIIGKTASGEWTLSALIQYHGADTPSACRLWAADVYNSTAKAITVNLHIPHTLPGFAKVVAFEFYRIEAAKMDEVASIVSAARGFGDQLTDAEKAAIDLLAARVDSARTAYEATREGLDTSSIPPIATAFACMLSNAQLDAYPAVIRANFDAVKNEIDSINRNFIPKCDDDKPNLKALRTALDTMTTAIWVKSAYTNAYTFHTNAALAYDVFRTSYNGRRLDGNGAVIRRFAQPKTIMQEVIYACLHCLQMKAAANADGATEQAKADFEKFWGYAPEEAAPVETAKPKASKPKATKTVK